MQPRAAIYARISETVSIVDKAANQVEQCRAFAAANGYEVVETFIDDGISATSGAYRPGWAALLDAIERNGFDVVLATEEERFSRGSRTDKADLFTACAASNTFWHTIRDGRTNPSDEESEFMSELRDSLGRREIRRKVSRQRAANVSKVSKGEPLRGGKRRFGYEPDHVTPRESEAEHVRWAYARVLDGGTLYSIQKHLNENGVLGSYGHQWDAPKVRKLILNERNAGILTHNGERQASSLITPLVDEETFKQAVAILSDPTRRTPGPKVSRGLMSGIAVCGICGAPMRSATNTQRGATAYLYKCSTKAEGRGHGEVHASVRRHLLDDQMPQLVYDGLLRLLRESDGIVAAESVKLGPLRVERAEVEKLRVIAEEQMFEPNVDRDRARRRLAALVKQAHDLDEKIAETSRNSAVSAVFQNALVHTEGIRAVAAMQRAPGVREIVSGIAHEEEFNAQWAALSIEDQRTLVRATWRVAVNPASTVEITKHEIIEVDSMPGTFGRTIDFKTTVIREGKKRFEFERATLGS